MDNSNYNINLILKDNDISSKVNDLLPGFSVLNECVGMVNASLTGLSETLGSLQLKLQETLRPDATVEGVQQMKASMDGLRLNLFELTGGFTGYAAVVAENCETAKNLASGLGMLQGGFRSVMSGLGNFMNLQFMVGTVLSMAHTRITALTRALGLHQVAAKASALATGALNLVMNANPIALVVTAIAALVAGFVTAYKNCSAFRDLVNKAFPGIGKLASGIADAFKAVCDWVGKAFDKVKAFFGLKSKGGKAEEMTMGLDGSGGKAELPANASWISTDLNQLAGLKKEASEYSLVVSNAIEKVGNLSKKQATVFNRVAEIPLVTEDQSDRASVAQEAGNLARGGVPMLAPSLKPSVQIPVEFDKEVLEESTAGLSNSLTKVKKFAVITGEQIASAVSNSVSSLAKGIGEAMVTGDWGEQLRGMLIGLMDMLQQFASALIATGIAALAFKSIFLNPVVGIIAGTALLVATAAAKAALQSATAFASGGIVSGPTLALVGEYSGASNNPEVIAPLNKLRSMIEPSNSSLNGLYLETKVRGKDLYVALRSVEHEKNRTR